MNFNDYFGYYPAAPTLVPVPTQGSIPPNAAASQTNSALNNVFSNDALAVDFSVSGWLVAAIVILAGVRIVWEIAEG